MDYKTITMEFIRGKQVKEEFNESDLSKVKPICKIIGEKVARLHNCGIIHGDLTSSNILLRKDGIVFIDFGLGKISHLVEDKGTDLLVFKKALTGIHYDIAEDCFQYILEGYRGADDFQKILEKIKEIEVRKRYMEN